MNIYYVYFYLRSNFTPYYVGKGKGQRSRKKEKSENIKLPKDKSKIILVEQNLTELQAFILERYYIRWFGRKDLGTGILRNRTDGGEGCSGRIVKDSTKEKISMKNKGRIKRERTIEEKLHQSNVMKSAWKKYDNNLRTVETKKKQSDAKIKNWSDETYRNNKINSIKNLWSDESSKLYNSTTKTYKIFPPENLNKEPFIIKNLTKFCKENGLIQQCMSNVSNGKQSNHKGWKCVKI